MRLSDESKFIVRRTPAVFNGPKCPLGAALRGQTLGRRRAISLGGVAAPGADQRGRSREPAAVGRVARRASGRLLCPLGEAAARDRPLRRLLDAGVPAARGGDGGPLRLRAYRVAQTRCRFSAGGQQLCGGRRRDRAARHPSPVTRHPSPVTRHPSVVRQGQDSVRAGPAVRRRRRPSE